MYNGLFNLHYYHNAVPLLRQAMIFPTLPFIFLAPFILDHYIYVIFCSYILKLVLMYMLFKAFFDVFWGFFGFFLNNFGSLVPRPSNKIQGSR
jgi:hypothetical protein